LIITLWFPTRQSKIGTIFDRNFHTVVSGSTNHNITPIIAYYNT
jgi:hypothetical protein